MVSDAMTRRRPTIAELSRRCAVELADTMAQASRVLARELVDARNLTELASASVSGVAEANARVCHNLASLLRDVSDECEGAPATDDDELGEMARVIAMRLPADG